MEMQTQSRATLEEMIFRMWGDCVDAAMECDTVSTEAIQKLLAETRKVVADAGWPATYSHDFFVGLAKLLKAGTLGHPTTKQIIRLLEIETEFD